MKCAFFNEMCIFISRPIGHFPTKHAFLPLPRIFRGCILQMVDVVMSEHNAGDNTLARMEMFAHNDSGFLVDGLLMLKSPAHAHAHNANIHVAIHTSTRSWFFDPQRNSSGITSIPSYSSSSVSSSMYTFQCVDL